MILKQAEAKWSLSNQITRQNLYLGGNGSDRKSGSHIWRGMNPSEMFCRLMAIDQSDPAPLFHLFADIGSGHHSHSQLPYVHHPSLLCIEDLRERKPESNLFCVKMLLLKNLCQRKQTKADSKREIKSRLSAATAICILRRVDTISHRILFKISILGLIGAVLIFLLATSTLAHTAPLVPRRGAVAT